MESVIANHISTTDISGSFLDNKAIGVLKPGHCFTIEPMICEGTHKEVIWYVIMFRWNQLCCLPSNLPSKCLPFPRPDQWTATTTDGKRSAQFEHTVLVTETGIEILT